MNTICFFTSESEYQSIIKLISLFIPQRYNIHNSVVLLIYLNESTSSYKIYSNLKTFPSSMQELIIRFSDEYILSDLLLYLYSLDQDDLRFCCNAALGNISQNNMSDFAHNLIKRIKPKSLLLLTNEHNQNEVDEYFSRRHVRYKLPMKEIVATSIDVALLSQIELQPRLRDELIQQITSPPLLPDPFIHKNKTLVLYIFDSITEANRISQCGSKNEPHIVILYNERCDTYRPIRVSVYEVEDLAHQSSTINILLELIGFYQQLYDLNTLELTICCSFNLGNYNNIIFREYEISESSAASTQIIDQRFYVTEVLKNLINRLRPTTLILIANSLHDCSDAQNYLARKSTVMGYTLPSDTKQGIVFDINNIDQQEFVDCIRSAPSIPFAPYIDLNGNHRSFAVYITHYPNQLFFMKPLISACSFINKTPYIYLYYDIEKNKYMINEISTFSSKQYYLSRELFKKQDILDTINMIKKDLGMSILELYVHSNIGNPKGEHVTLELEEWVIDLQPSFIGLLYTEKSKSDTFLYSRGGITALNVKLRAPNVSCGVLDEQLMLGASTSTPELLADRLANSVQLLPGYGMGRPQTTSSQPSFYTHSSSWMSYFFQRNNNNAVLLSKPGLARMKYNFSLYKDQKIHPSKRRVAFDQTVLVNLYSCKLPAKTGCGFMKIHTLSHEPYSVKDILRLFHYQHGILLYNNQLFHIDVNLLLEVLRKHSDYVFYDMLLDSNNEFAKIKIIPTSQNSKFISLIKEYFDEIKWNEYTAAKGHYLLELFNTLTEHNMPISPKQYFKQLRM